MNTTIYFIRHAKTRNPHMIVKGLLPGFELTQAGKKEVAKLAKYLQNKPIKSIYCSPLTRTRQTAAVFHKFLPQAKLIPDKRLLEWQTAWEGKTMKLIKADPQMDFPNYLNDPLKFRTIKGPTAKQIVKNMLRFTNFILKKHPGQQIIAVSHGDPIKLLRCWLETGKISRRFSTYTCHQPSITGFVFNNHKFSKTLYKSYVKKQYYYIQ